MSPENTSKLLAAYPLLYRELRERGFECEDGWFDLVWQVSADIESAAQIDGTQKTAEAWPSVGVLKQKFGTLRVQFQSRVSESIETVTAKAYEQSMMTCELCGEPAQPIDRTHRPCGAIETLCENCRTTHRPPRAEQTGNRPLPVWMQERNKDH